MSEQFLNMRWKIRDSWQIEKQTHASKTKHTQKKQTKQNSKTKPAWFSLFLQHSASKRGGLILQRC